MTKQYDVIIIGGGHNSLVTAAYLGRAALSTLVLERRDVIGGSAVTEELIPGYQIDSLVSGVSWLHPKVMSDLNLAAHGLEVMWSDATVSTPSPDGGLTLWRDMAKSAESIRRHSAKDAERFPEFAKSVKRVTTLAEQVYSLTPPDVVNGSLMELMSFAQTALGLRSAGDDALFETIRMLPMPIYDWLKEWFESDLLKATLAAAGIHNLTQGPMSVGTVYTFLHHHVGMPLGVFRALGQVKGGIGKLTHALASAAQQNRAEIRTGAEVAEIMLNAEGRAVGVRLASGEEISAKAVASGADPRHTMLGLVDAAYLDPHYQRQIRNIRFKGSRARVHLALGGLPAFAGVEADALRGVISVSPDVKYLEWAYDDAKHGRISEHPYLEATLPTLSDPVLALSGKHLMSVSFQFAPYALKGGWDDKAKKKILAATLDTLEGVAPGIKGLVEASHILTPMDMETTYGLPEGALYHGEMMLDQLMFMRPVPGWGQYKTPIDGLYLCGAGTHPGGGLTGSPGFNAAREIAKGLRR